MQETENFPKYNPNLFFKAAARILKILCRFEAPNVTCFVVCIYTECIKKNILWALSSTMILELLILV